MAVITIWLINQMWEVGITMSENLKHVLLSWMGLQETLVVEVLYLENSIILNLEK